MTTREYDVFDIPNCWRIVGAIPDQPKVVAIVAPHTSNWDFVVGLLARYALRLDASWLGKHTLFRWPLGPVLRRLEAGETTMKVYGWD